MSFESKFDGRDEGTTIECPFCPEKYAGEHNLLEHIYNKHTIPEVPTLDGGGLIAYKCPFCSEEYGGNIGKHNLLEHIKNKHPVELTPIEIELKDVKPDMSVEYGARAIVNAIKKDYYMGNGIKEIVVRGDTIYAYIQDYYSSIAARNIVPITNLAEAYNYLVYFKLDDRCYVIWPDTHRSLTVRHEND